ncbi:hypothetical protein KFL_002090190 [Klebsormidium nitens]|uniref:LTD domain-containing protein n=1 Tax=Klebsormidium nitens TaxID=105231 RepID=A0A1Y1I839_KLENI|nr:hypothetical protein KFL_002090190 [Klebsormidium nitens]|eukprot:GAQ84867.1 hypothetical protein KFL_002090190 [Klebsormidium nitens]
MAAPGRLPALVMLMALLAVALFPGADARIFPERRSLAQTGVTAVFFDEIHWDNNGTDVAEAVEIFGPVGTDVTGYKLTRYAGAGGLCSTSVCPLPSGPTLTFPAGSILRGDGSSGSTTSGTIVVVFPVDGLTNSGAGMALSDPASQLLDFISWSSTSNTFTVTASANTGPASGETSTPVSPRETSSTPVGYSVQRTGSTTWSSPAANSFGPAYAGQAVPSSEGPRIIGAGNLPSQLVVDGLLTSTGYRGTAPTGGNTSPPTPVGSTVSSPPPALSTSNPPPVDTTVSSPPPAGGATGTCGSAGETPIYAINGNGQAQAIADKQVVTSGIVTGEFDEANRLNGIFIQTPDAQADPITAGTSNGLFVYFVGTSRATFPATAPGDYIQVSGTIVNYNGLPEMNAVTALTICSSGNPPPTISPVTLPTDLRQYLSMQVNFPQTLTVTDNYNDDFYGEIELSVNGRRYVPTQVADPGAPANAVAASNDAQAILVDDGSSLTSRSSPPLKPPYPYPGLSDSNTIRVGYTLAGPLNGDLSYGSSFGYLVEPIGNPSSAALTFDPSTNPRPTAGPAVAGSLKVVGMNLENFFTQLQANGCSSSDCRGAKTQQQFDTQLAKEVLAITALNGDIYAFQELQNNGFGPSSAIATLTNAVNNAVGAGTYAFIRVNQPDGGSPSIISTDPNCARQCVGGDAITVGMMYRVSAVTPVGAARAITKNVDPTFPSDNTRPSVAQTFADNQGGKITVVANHLKSKGSACSGDADQKDGQGNCNLTRQRAAAAIVRWLASDPTGSNDPDFLLLGDMNAYAKEDPIKTFEAGGFVNMIAAKIGPLAYSYVFGGESGYLDHALASSALAPQVQDVAEFHINADEPIVLHYDSPTGLASPTSMYRCSDHDPVILGMTLTPSSSALPPPAANPPPIAANPPPASVNPPPAAADSQPPPVVNANPPPVENANPPPVAIPSPPTAEIASPPPVEVASPPPVQNASPPPVQISSPPPVQIASPPPVQIASPPPVQIASPPPLAKSSPPAVATPTPVPTNPKGGCGNACNCPNENACTNGNKPCAWFNNACRKLSQPLCLLPSVQL